MANYSAQLVPPMLKAMHGLSGTLGTDVMMSQKETYNIVLEVLALIAMGLKLQEDLNPATVTDSILGTRLSSAVDTGPNGDRSGWPGWVILQVKPEDLAMYGATESDSVASLQAKIAAYNAQPH